MAGRRCYQDYVAWLHYGTNKFWEELQSRPYLANELVSQRLHAAGLVNPAETTSAAITAGIAVLQHGPASAYMADEQLQQTFNAFKVSGSMESHVSIAVATAVHLEVLTIGASISVGCGSHRGQKEETDGSCMHEWVHRPQVRIKQLANKQPPVYIETLPASPVDLLRLYPVVAGALFDRENLPVECPINTQLMDHVRSRIACRGSGRMATVATQQLGANAFAPILQGRACTC